LKNENGFLVYLRRNGRADAQKWREIVTGRDKERDKMILKTYPLEAGEWDLPISALEQMTKYAPPVVLEEVGS
jgi:hypothetical protein